ncbi:MAG: energy transducer TonB [Gemmatimonadota bacterium]
MTRQDLEIALSPDSPSFIPFDTPPRLKNREEIARLLKQRYPRNLKKNRASGTVLLWIYINQDGRVEKSQVRKRSFHPEFDVAALKIAARMRFVPAKAAGKPIAVWVQMPMNFRLK